MGQTSYDNISVSSQFLNRLFRSCLEIGARKPVLLEALGLAEPELRDPRTKYGSKAVSILCQTTAQELGSDAILSDIGREMIPSGFSDFSHAAMFGATLRDVLQAAAAALDFGMHRPLMKWQELGHQCRLTWDRESDAADELVSVVFSILCHVAQTITRGGPPVIKAACFRNRGGKNYDSLISTEYRTPKLSCFFNQPDTCLEFHQSLVDLPNPFRNAAVVRAAGQQFAQFQINGGKSVPLAKLSYNYLFHLLDKSGLGLDAAADTFGMAERTLRRKLVAEGASFRQILEQVRRDTCQLYFLEGTRSLSEIATKLGYSELSAFTRAYTAWHGRSPSRDLAAHIALAA